MACVLQTCCGTPKPITEIGDTLVNVIWSQYVAKFPLQAGETTSPHIS